MQSLQQEPPPPPFVWTDHFSIAKTAVGVLLQGKDDSVEYLLHACNLDVLLAADKVLVDGLEPPGVVMAVGNDVDVDGILPPVRCLSCCRKMCCRIHGGCMQGLRSTQRAGGHHLDGGIISPDLDADVLYSM